MTESAPSKDDKMSQGDTVITSMNSKEYFFTWIINDFSVRFATDKGTQHSPKFPSGLNEKVQWDLQFDPIGDDDKQYCGLYLKFLSTFDTHNSIETKCKMTLLSFNSTIIKEASFHYKIELNSGYGWSELIKHGYLLEKTKTKDTLIIKCEVKAYFSVVTQTIKGSRIQLPNNLSSSLAKDLGALVDGDKFGDVTIEVGGEQFRAYKGILATRSTVFAAMFEHEMQENVENRLTIADIEPAVFKLLLRYIYTGKVACQDSAVIRKLFAAADKYAVATLKGWCRVFMLKKLDADNAAEVLTLADLHNDLEMKKHVIEFITVGVMAPEVTKTEGWKELVKGHPQLTDEVIEAMASKICAAEKN